MPADRRTQMIEWALTDVSLALLSLVEILAYPTMNMSTVPSETFGPNREVMSSGGTAEPTFHVTMYTLSEGRHGGNAAADLQDRRGHDLLGHAQRSSDPC